MERSATVMPARGKETSGTDSLALKHFSCLRPDYLLFAFIILAVNTHLVTGGFDTSLIFLPGPVGSGEWWRIFTFPFVHITWYHLVLDAGAFFMLYKDIEHEKAWTKVFYLTLCGATSLSAALLCSPAIYSVGLCGLSGIAHGLMAVSGLYMMQKGKQFRFGLACFSIVVCKSIYETIMGDVVFSFMHLGLCGTPLAACHAGGVLGGIIAYSIVMKTGIAVPPAKAA